MKDSFARNRDLNWLLFPFSTLYISTHCLWLQRFLLRNQLIIILRDPFFMKSCFSIAAFRILSLSWLSIVSLFLFVGLKVYPMWSLLGFLDLYIRVFHEIWDILIHYFFKYYFCPNFPLSYPSGIPVIHMLACIMLSHKSFSLCFICGYFCVSFLKFYLSDNC